MKRRRWVFTGAALLVVAFASAAHAQERVARPGWLGFSWEATDQDNAESVRIASVYPGSPAASAGMRSGDEIVRWNGSADVESTLETLRLQPGDTVHLRIRRESQRDRDLAVVAAQRPARAAVLTPGRETAPFGMPPENWEEWQNDLRRNREEIARLFREGARDGVFRADSIARLWGPKVDSLAVHADSLHKGIQLLLRDSLGPQLQALREQVRIFIPDGTSRTVFALGQRSVAGAEFEEMSEGLASYFGTDEGALVLRVSPGTPAARAGLQAGDVVLEANERQIDSVDDLRESVARAQRSRSRSVQLEVLRRGERHELDLRWE